MDYKVLITSDAESDLEGFIRYLLYEKKSEQAASNVLNDFEAPTQTLWVNKDGETFIADSEILADLWGNGEDVKPTGAWKIFVPQKEGE